MNNEAHEKQEAYAHDKQADQTYAHGELPPASILERVGQPKDDENREHHEREDYSHKPVPIAAIAFDPVVLISVGHSGFATLVFPRHSALWTIEPPRSQPPDQQHKLAYHNRHGGECGDDPRVSNPDD